MSIIGVRAAGVSVIVNHRSKSNEENQNSPCGRAASLSKPITAPQYSSSHSNHFWIAFGIYTKNQSCTLLLKINTEKHAKILFSDPTVKVAATRRLRRKK